MGTMYSGNCAANHSVSFSRRRPIGVRHRIARPAWPPRTRRAPRRRMTTTPCATPGCSRNTCLDFPQLDAIAAHLHLIVGAAEELERAIGETAHAVACAIHALAAEAR